MTGSVVVRIVLVALLAVASLSKVLRQREFADSLADFGIRHAGTRRVLAAVATGTELLLALALAVWPATAIAFSIAVVFLGFAVALVYLRLSAQPDVPATCGCLGRRRAVRWTAVALNACCAIAALWLSR